MNAFELDNMTGGFKAQKEDDDPAKGTCSGPGTYEDISQHEEQSGTVHRALKSRHLQMIAIVSICISLFDSTADDFS